MKPALKMKTALKRIILLLIAAVLVVSVPPPLTAGEKTISLPQAISKTIEINAGIKIQATTVDQQAGAVQTAQGEFDWFLYGGLSREEAKTPLPQADQATLNGRVIDEAQEKATVYAAGATKKFRNGIVIEPSVSSTDYENNTKRQDPINQSDLTVELVFPLMRGSGEQYTLAGERSAQTDLAAVQSLSTHNIANRIFNTASAYWGCLAARQQNDILSDSQRRTNEIFQLVELLVKGGEIEPALLRQARAELYSRRADLVDGQRTLTASRLALAAAIGFSPDESQDPPVAEGSFPTTVDDSLFTETAAAGYVQKSLLRRGDYLAARKTVDSKKILLDKALNGTRPRVDFTVRAGYAGLDESLDGSRFYGSFSRNASGLNTYAGIRMELPVRNDVAWGEVRTRRAVVREAELNAEDLGNNLAAQVRITLSNLKAAIRQYGLARNAAGEYRLSLDHLGRKVKGGEASLTDLIDMEDRYLKARIAEIEALRKYAVAIVELRFVTGSLLTRESDHLRFRVSDLTIPPPWDDHRK